MLFIPFLRWTCSICTFPIFGLSRNTTNIKYASSIIYHIRNSRCRSNIKSLKCNNITLMKLCLEWKLFNDRQLCFSIWKILSVSNIYSIKIQLENIFTCYVYSWIYWRTALFFFILMLFGITFATFFTAY